MDRARVIDFTMFVLCTLIILFVTLRRGVFLIAPPYDVSAYLVIFEKQSRFSKPTSTVFSYIAVIVSSLILHYTLGDSVVSLALNVLIVAAFISFTRYSHPPALALTIFSYLTGDLLGFTLTSLLVLLIIFTVAQASNILLQHIKLVSSVK
ncbi:MAG: HPP family protein [Thermoprotei archaeon]